MYMTVYMFTLKNGLDWIRQQKEINKWMNNIESKENTSNTSYIAHCHHITFNLLLYDSHINMLREFWWWDVQKLFWSAPHTTYSFDG